MVKKQENQDIVLTAEAFIDTLKELKTEKELKKLEKYFKGEDKETQAFGVKFGDVFKIAKKYKSMSIEEIEKLLESKYYEIRMGAVSIMDYQAKDKKTTPEKKKELFDLYLRRHDRLNNWDFVDRGAYNIIGEYLIDKDRKILYQLAESDDPWERRTAIVSTYAFIKKGQVEDTFKIAEILLYDEHELINKAVGSWIREAGKKDREKLLAFLDQHGKSMPRVTLRMAIEKLDPEQRYYYMKLKP
ncbi:DNA alkylation repair protein [Streptococcus pluranimalium]|uniref:DNA alkylation repair protein n=1 Tax=Streptococcus pluranimalium TaxID=82348 RepID=UPI003BF8C2E4